MKEDMRKNLCNRLNRAEGQIRALRTAIEQDNVDDCRAFIIQVKAARAALKRVSEQFVLEHIHQCDTLPNKEKDQQIGEAINLLAGD